MRKPHCAGNASARSIATSPACKQYRVVEPISRIEFVLSDEPLVAGLDPVVTTFTEVEGGDEVSLFQPAYGFSDEQIAATVAGYNAFFDALEKVVSSIK